MVEAGIHNVLVKDTLLNKLYDDSLLIINLKRSANTNMHDMQVVRHFSPIFILKMYSPCINRLYSILLHTIGFLMIFLKLNIIYKYSFAIF